MIKDVASLVATAKETGIAFVLLNGKLTLKIQHDNHVDKDIVEQIKQQKSDIITYLEKYGQGLDDAKDSENKILVNNPDIIPLSFQQESLWFIDALTGTVQYHIPYVCKLKGRVVPEVLEKACIKLLERHKVLRTVIKEYEGKRVQVVMKSDPWTMHRFDLRPAPEDSVDDFVQEFILRPFDLKTDILFRAALVSIANDEYIFAIVIHHIAFDGWSAEILLKEMGIFYNAGINGKAAGLPEISLNYGDYASWQRNRNANTWLEPGLIYWKDKLSGVKALAFQCDCNKDLVAHGSGKSRNIFIEKKIRQAILHTCKMHNTSLFVFMVSVFKILIFRYSGESDICIGSPVACRDRKEIEQIVGYFANMLPLRTNITGNLSFKDVLLAVKHTMAQAIKHQHIPFSKIVEALNPDRVPKKNPLFQFICSLVREAEKQYPEFDNISIEPADYSHLFSKFDLELTIIESDERLGLSMRFNRENYDTAFVNAMLHHFENLLYSIVDCPDLPVESLSMLDLEERHFLIHQLNHKNDFKFNPGTLVDLFEDQCNKTPHATALVFNDTAVSYQELNRRSLGLADFLTHKGVCAESLVAIVFDRSVEMIVAIMAILRAGGAFVPIDPDFPTERIQFMMEEIDAPVILTNIDRRHGCFKNINRIIIHVDEVLLKNLDQPIGKTDNLPLPGSLAYVMYTSGTTGVPKGVMIEHASIVNYLLHQISLFRITEKDRILQFSNYTFDPFIEQLFISLSTGATLFLITKEIQLDPLLLAEFIRQNRITHFHATPSFLARIDLTSNCPDLKRIVSGGEECSPVLAAKWGKQIEFFNKYGPTEATISVAVCRMNGKKNLAIVPVGQLVSNTQAYIIDKIGNLLPFGMPGELCIGGLPLARGYLNRPDLNAEKFTTNGVKELPGTSVYKTGDLMRWNCYAELEYMGRIDDQVKVRGFRIELAEITNALVQFPYVKHAIAMVEGETPESRRLVAFVICETGFTKEALTEFLRKSLPQYMIPSKIVEVDNFPLTSNGKIDKRQLLECNRQDIAKYEESLALTDTERKLKEIWEKLLQVTDIAVDSNFFELGGHSLLAVDMAEKIKQVFTYRLEIARVFSNSTIRSLAKLIDAGSTTQYNEITLVPEKDLYPTSHAQQRIWILSQMSNGSQAYSMPGARLLTGHLDFATFETCVKDVIARHGVLRTVFVEHDGMLMQRILPVSNGIHDVTLVNLRGNEKWEENITDYFQKEARKAFDLQNGPLWRLTLFLISEEKHVLLFNIHHSVCDEWSRKILLQELLENYDLKKAGKTLSRENNNAQYKDYVEWHTSVYIKQENYWNDLLQRNFPLMNFPSDFPRTDTFSFQGKNIVVELPAFRVDQLKELAARYKVTLSTILVALYGLHVSLQCRQPDLLIGVLMSGRMHAGLENMIGVFVNYIPIPVHADTEVTMNVFLEENLPVILKCYAHQDYPFDKMVSNAKLKRDISRNPFFDTLINCHLDIDRIYSPDLGFITNEDGRLTASAYPIVLDDEYALLDFQLDVHAEKTGLRFILNYNTQLFLHDRMEKFMTTFLELLAAAGEQQDKLLSGYRCNYDCTLDTTPVVTGAGKNMEKTEISISASFVIDPIEPVLSYWNKEMDMGCSFLLSPYNQIFQELYNPTSQFYSANGVNVIFLRIQDWIRFRKYDPVDVLLDFIKTNATGFIEALVAFRNKFVKPFFIAIIPLGNSRDWPKQLALAMEQIRVEIEARLKKVSGFYFIDVNEAVSLYKVEDVYDAKSDELAHVPFTPEYYTALGTLLIRKISAWKNPGYKVIALDCDNTLWKGICGELGSGKVTIGNEYAALQQFMIEKYQSGFLLLLCSKNNEADVWDVFDNHPEMALTREHIITHRINWEPKAHNLKSMAQELGLNLSSFIFIDDSQWEIEQMNAIHPEVLSICLPDEDLQSFLEHNWAFDHLTVTDTDLTRNELYRAEKSREKEKDNHTSLESFLQSLELNVACRIPLPADFARAEQLSMRTTQFNLNGVFRTQPEIASRTKAPNGFCYLIDVTDRFGDYGTVGLLMGYVCEDELALDAFMLSCRVLGRQVEVRVLDELFSFCKKANIGVITADFVVTGKNIVFQRFLEQAGWVKSAKKYTMELPIPEDYI